MVILMTSGGDLMFRIVLDENLAIDKKLMDAFREAGINGRFPGGLV